MFQKPTAFIVGAGAGWDYKMPTGEGLKSMIVNKIKENDESFYYAIQTLGTKDGRYNGPIYDRARKFIPENLHLAPSIDNFLHTHADDKAVVELGKLAIAACILDAERNSALSVSARDGYRIDLNRAKEFWLNTFCKMALEGVQKNDRHSVFDNIAIITFNYDRCIEHYVAQHLESYLGIPKPEAQTLAGKLNIIHVYGRVGFLEWQMREPALRYGEKYSPTQLAEVTQSIRTFTERVENDDTPAEIASVLAEAELIVTSGFSFGSSNWEFLENRTSGRPKTVIAGVYGISDPNQQNIARKLRSYLHPGEEVEVYLCAKGFPDLLSDYSTYII